jgi:peptidoglycan LD-endopeptidase LytH
MTTDSPPHRRPPASYLLGSGLLGFVLGAFVVASLGTGATGGRASPASAEAPPVAPGIDEGGGVAAVPAPTTGRADPGRETGIGGGGGGKPLGERRLEIPVQGVQPRQLVRSYHDARTGGREHEALDILAPRNTPVIAVEDGTIARLFLSKAGGNTIYQFDPRQEYCYYYAHLERYADGLHEGDRVTRGEVLGYVGTSGDAPRNTPHLHFAIFRLTADKHWWEGTPLDPYDVLAGR